MDRSGELELPFTMLCKLLSSIDKLNCPRIVPMKLLLAFIQFKPVLVLTPDAHRIDALCKDLSMLPVNKFEAMRQTPKPLLPKSHQSLNSESEVFKKKPVLPKLAVFSRLGMSIATRMQMLYISSQSYMGIKADCGLS